VKVKDQKHEADLSLQSTTGGINVWRYGAYVHLMK
jgi:hypothetical protein